MIGNYLFYEYRMFTEMNNTVLNEMTSNTTTLVIHDQSDNMFWEVIVIVLLVVLFYAILFSFIRERIDRKYKNKEESDEKDYID